jgi:hypothetical protein
MSIRARNIDQKKGRETALGLPICWTWPHPNPSAQDVHTALAITAGQNVVGTVSSLAVDAQPTKWCTLSCSVPTDAGGTALDVDFIITGITSYGEAVQETVANVTNAGGAKSTNYAYRQVDAIQIRVNVAGDAGADTMAVVEGVRLGSPVRLQSSTDVLKFYTAVIEGAATGPGTDYTPLTLTTDGTPATGEVDVNTTYSTFGFHADQDFEQSRMYIAYLQSTYDLIDLSV